MAFVVERADPGVFQSSTDSLEAPALNAARKAQGGGLYKPRQTMIEPVFAHMKSNRGILRLMRRGRSAVRSEWRLITATNNLLKLHKHQLAAAAARGGPVTSARSHRHD